MLPGYSGITATELPKLLPADEYTDELVVMADVRSYFQVAYKARISLALQFACTRFDSWAFAACNR